MLAGWQAGRLGRLSNEWLFMPICQGLSGMFQVDLGLTLGWYQMNSTLSKRGLPMFPFNAGFAWL